MSMLDGMTTAQRAHVGNMCYVAGNLAAADERARCVEILRKHVATCSDGRCCDNCRCEAVRLTLAELTENQS